MKHEGSSLVNRQRCPECEKQGKDRSGDNLGVFDDSHAYCFSCGFYRRAEGTEPITIKKVKRTDEDWRPVQGRLGELAHRAIDKDVCRQFRYNQAQLKKYGYCEVADYIVDGKQIAQHVRTENKRFFWIGTFADVRLWGQHMWRSGGKRIIVTEGEIDAMTVYQVMGKKWPVVSIPSGIKDAANAVRKSLEFLSSYNEVIFCFDMDEVGQEAAIECAQILPAGKSKIVHLPRKDPNTMLLKGETAPLLNALWDAQTYRPDGIVHVRDVGDTNDEGQEIWPFPWPDLNKALIGQRSREMTMWTSGTGMGKSTVLRTLVYHHLKQGRSVGVCMLEESIHDTRDDIISIMIEKPVRQIKAARALNEALTNYGEEVVDFGLVDTLSDEEYDKARHTIESLPLYLYDHQGAKDYDGILAKIEYMVIGLGCKVIILDHITAVVAGTEYNGKGERRGIDELMGQLSSLATRTGAHLDVVSQLRKPDGKPFEEGARISAADLRGSGSLASVPNTIVAIERNQQHADPVIRNTVTIRVLKNRFFGDTGIVAALRYHRDTAGLEPVEWHEDMDGKLTFGPQLIEEDDDDTADFLSPAGESDQGTDDGAVDDDVRQEADDSGRTQPDASRRRVAESAGTG